MITHFHVRLQLPGTDIYRDVVLPDSVILDDINQVISVCFGWPLTEAYEFVPQQTKTSYVGDTHSHIGIKQSIPADNITLSFAFQKNREIIYYRSAQEVDQVVITLLTTKSLLPEPAFQLNGWNGENRACTRGCIPFLKQKVEDDLQALRADLYLLADEFDYERAATDPNYLKELNDLSFLEGGVDPETNPELKELLDYLTQNGMSEESIAHTSTLAQCLAILTDEALLELARFHHLIDDLSDEVLSRSQIEDKLLAALTDEEFMAEQLKVLTIPEIEILDFLTQANMPVHSQDVTTHGNYILRCGLCFVDETEMFLTAPEELRALYKKLLQKEDVMMEIQYFDMLHTFCYTAVYLYGIYPIRKLIRIISETMHMIISPDELKDTLKRAAAERYDYVFRDDMIIAAELAQDDPVYEDAINQLKKLHEICNDFFWPDMEQLESIIFQRRLANEQLYHQFAADFAPYLREGNNPMQVLQIIEYWLRSGISALEVAGLLAMQFFRFRDYDITKKLADSLIAISDQTPMWSRCGYTPAQDDAREAKRQLKVKTTAAAKKSDGKSTAKVISLQEHRDKKKNNG